MSDFLVDVRKALGFPEGGKPSKYGFVKVGSKLISVRLSDHNVKAKNYLRFDSNFQYNISIVINRKKIKKTFSPNDDVILDEYVYLGRRLKKIEGALVKILDSIIGFLKKGIFIDETDVALHNSSPGFESVDDIENTENVESNDEEIVENIENTETENIDDSIYYIKVNNKIIDTKTYRVMNYKDIQQKSFDFYMQLVWDAQEFLDELSTQIANDGSWDEYASASTNIESIEHSEDDRLIVFWKDGGQDYVDELTPDEVLDIVKDLMG